MDAEYFEGLNGYFYKTTGDLVWVLMPFGWIISAEVKKSDLDNGLFKSVSFDEIKQRKKSK